MERCCWCEEDATVLLVEHWTCREGGVIPRTIEIRDPACAACASVYGPTYQEIRHEPGEAYPATILA